MSDLELHRDHRVRLAEMVCVIALATDLGTGVAFEHAARTCLLSVELGRRLGLGVADLADLYYLTLLRMAGCTAESAGMAHHFADEVEFGRQTRQLDYGDPEGCCRWVMQSFATDQPPAERQRLMANLLAYTPEARREALAGHCEVAQMLGRRLGMSHAVIEGLDHVFERWDGSGSPAQRVGEQVPLIARVMTLCNELEIHHELGGVDAALEMARSRAGTQFEPALVTEVCGEPSLLDVLSAAPAKDAVLAAEPGRPRHLTAAALMEAGHAIAEFADMKSTHLAGHSTGVAALAAAAGERLGLDEAAVAELRLAGLSHDVGRAGVTTSIWDKAGPLTEAEWEKVRLHPYHTERVLARATRLQSCARLAGSHHERLDSSGYHRGSSAGVLGVPARVLAAADAYHAMIEGRPHRPALAPDEAAAEIRSDVAAGRLDPDAARAVLAAAGQPESRLRAPWPAGLTDREVDVLRQIARGASIQSAAEALHVAPKTVDYHLQNIYSKAGVTTRAAATLFAIQNDLLRGEGT